MPSRSGPARSAFAWRSGALPRDVLRHDRRPRLGLSAAGVVVGLAAALALGRFIQGQLFGVTLFDPVTLGSVALVLGASAGAGELPSGAPGDEVRSGQRAARRLAARGESRRRTETPRWQGATNENTGSI